MALYGISEDEVTQLLEKTAGQLGRKGRDEVTDDHLAGKYGYPLKVVYDKERKRQ